MASLGSRRIVVGAHYGLGDWLVQRATAVLLLVYGAVLAIRVFLGWPLGYDGWAELFVPPSMKIATLIAFACIAYHAWIGMRDVWMDYVRSVAVRLVLHVATILWLIACLVWAARILWMV